ncbi:hypothetical protein [Listeria ivanovii]|uniref:hypothetical protein n=1 Tax=Listeria ivanovii TaxID=1638 RepID=UPI0019444E04|nr:hypothetical protein [Listeria ivanovii]
MGDDVVKDLNDEVKQMVLNTDGNYYFTTSKDLSNSKKKVDKKNIYLTKINKKSLPAYIEELNEKIINIDD